MSEKYNFIHDLSDEQLEELLCQAVEDEQTDIKYIESILEVIEEREKSKPVNHLSDIKQAWNDFQNIYNTPEGEGRSLYEFSDTDSGSVIAAPQPKKMLIHVVKRVLLVALVSCICFLMMATALGYDVFQAIGSWTREVFYFAYSQEASPSPSPGYSADQPKRFDNFQEALDASNIVEFNAPTYLPEGFVQTEVYLVPHLLSNEIQAFYTSEDLSIQVCITQFEDTYSVQYEKDETPVEEVVIHGITHYLFSNNGRSVTTWNIDSIEGSITGDISLEEMRKILNSMY